MVVNNDTIDVEDFRWRVVTGRSSTLSLVGAWRNLLTLINTEIFVLDLPLVWMIR
jgi:hypothetical protein